ncbi:uncharacterized protein LOC115211069 isoform X1 [Argonauta hians]
MAVSKHTHVLYRNIPSLTLSQILLLQAHLRGFIVRNRMKKLRTEFEEIVREIHPDGNVHVVWKTDCLCLPEISSKEGICTSPAPINANKHKSKSPGYLSNHPNNKTCIRTTKHSSISGIESSGQKEVHSFEELVEKDNNPSAENSSYSEQSKAGVKIPLAVECSDIDIEGQPHNQSNSFSRTEDSLPINAIKEPVMKHGSGKSPSPFFLPQSTLSLLDCSSFTDVTSVWDSCSSSPDTSDDEIKSTESTNSFLKERQNLVMELVWIQQAISSRKNYLHLKSQIETVSSMNVPR